MKKRSQPKVKKNVVLLNQRPQAAVVLSGKVKQSSVPASKVLTAVKRQSLSAQPSSRINGQPMSRRRRSSSTGPNWRKIGRGVAWGALILIIIVAGYGLFCSPYFRATSVAIDGTKLLEASQLSQQAETALQGHFWQIWRGNFWLVSSQQLCQPLKDYNLVSCRLQRQWPNKLTLKIEEEPVVAIWQENGWYYWVDRFGRVVRQELPNPASAKLYPVVNSNNILVNGRQVAINPDLWALIVASQTDWPGQAPRNFIFNNQEPNSLQAVLANQQIVKLTLRDSLANQLKLWQAGQSKFAQQLSQAKVIDLRYGDRIIFQ